MNNQHRISDINKRESIKLFQLRLWLTHLKSSGEEESEADIGMDLPEQTVFDSMEKGKRKRYQQIRINKMKTKDRILKGLVMILLLLAGTMGAMAQVGSLTNTDDQTVCIGSVEPYGVKDNLGSTYSWTITPSDGGTISATSNLADVEWTKVGIYLLRVVERNASGCDGLPTTLTITVTPLPAPVATADTPCENGTLNLTGAPAGMASYAWTGPNGFTSAAQSPVIANVTLAAVGTYTLTVTNLSGCTATSSVNVTINPLPAPVATADTPCENGTLNLTGAPAGMASYAWTGPNGFTSAAQSPAIVNVTLAASGTYILTVTNSNGCSASSTVVVKINPLPNTSPIYHN